MRNSLCNVNSNNATVINYRSLITTIVLVACTKANEPYAMDLTLTSSAFGAGEEIAAKYTCEGEDVSPPLSWRNLPAGTRSLVLIMDDPDAPDPAAPKMTWVHWLLYNIPPTADGLPEGATALPKGTKIGLNDWERSAYGGPCPPIGRHRYVLKLYALDTVLSGQSQPFKAELESAMAGHVLGKAELVGTYQKHQ